MGFLIRRLIFMVAPVLWRKFQQRRRSKEDTNEEREETARKGHE